LAGVDVILIEAKEICGGVTGYTTAKVTAQHGLIYSRILSESGIEKAEQYYMAQSAAIGEIKSLCGQLKCEFVEAPSYVYSLAGSDRLEKENKAIERIGGKSELVSEVEIPLKVDGAIRMDGQGMINPLELFYSMAGKLRVYEHTKAVELMPGCVNTDRGKIQAENIVVTTHFPILNKHGFYFLKMYQHRSYVLSLRGAKTPRGMYVDECDTGMSFRSYKDNLLLGGGGHRTGKKGEAWREIEAFAKEKYPTAEITDRWSTQDCMTLDGVSYIGKYGRKTENLYVATGFNKWGMTNSFVAADIISGEILGKRRQWSEVFVPSRRILRPQLAINAGEALLGWLTPTAPRCPHLGCALKYNKEEHSWDCPCHGSRFSEDGELIEGPATDDKRI
jgi:glycine/D-amino acid oxidase-like deaminating enzyme